MKPTVLQVVQAAARLQETGTLPEDQAEMASFHRNAIRFVTAKAVKKGYLEYGVSMRMAWPTPKGWGLIKDAG